MSSDNKTPETQPEKSRYTIDRGIVGAFEGETVTRRSFMTGAALGFGGLASAAFLVPALGMALGPVFEKSNHNPLVDIGAEADFNSVTFISKVITVVGGIGEAGKTTIYVRKNDGKSLGPNFPYLAVTSRCAHLGCPVSFVKAAKQFICPCHGGTYNFDGEVTGGPPVRPLDRFVTVVSEGRVLVGERFSLNSDMERVSTRDPGAHVDGPWQFLYPPRLTP